MYPVKRWGKHCITHFSVWDSWHALDIPALSRVENFFSGPATKIMHEHVPFCLMIGFACVCCGIKPPGFSMGSHHSIPIHPLAGHRRLLRMYARRRYRRLLWTLSPVFSKDRSRVWLMSRLSWTGWLASKTPWFLLTTYHRRQKMKREGNKYSCIVHYINTCTFEHKKIDQIPNVCQSSHIVVSSNEFRTLSDILVFWWDGKRVYGSVVERTGGLTLFVSSVPL